MAENTIDVNIQPHILAAIDSNKALQDAAKGPGIKKADRKKILAETDSIAGRISAVQDLVNNNSISGDKALKEIQSIFTTLSKATISLMGYSNAVKAELTRLNDEIQQKRNELNNIKDEYVNLKGSPNKIVYAGRQKDKNGEFIPGTEESISQYSLPGEDIEKIVSQTAPDIHEKITSKQRLQDIANGEDSTITDPKAIQEAAEALKLVESAQTNIRGLLNDNLNLQKQLNEEVDKLNVVLDQTNEKADITKGTDITSLENLQNAYGEMQKQIEKLQAAIEALNNEKSKAKDNAGAAAAVEEKEEKSVKKTDGTVTKAIKSFFGYQQVIRALRTVVNFTVKTIKDLDKALTDQSIVSGLTREQT
jgi:chromosome segregation ATPase